LLAETLMEFKCRQELVKLADYRKDLLKIKRKPFLIMESGAHPIVLHVIASF